MRHSISPWMKDGYYFAWMKDGFPSSGLPVLDRTNKPSPFVGVIKITVAGIRCLDPGGIQNPNPGSGSVIHDKHSGSHFIELSNNFWVKNLKTLCCGSGIRWFFDTGPWMEKFGSGIRDPGSATLDKMLIFCVSEYRASLRVAAWSSGAPSRGSSSTTGFRSRYVPHTSNALGGIYHVVIPE
jgi:hypothetical protein